MEMDFGMAFMIYAISVLIVLAIMYYLIRYATDAKKQTAYLKAQTYLMIAKAEKEGIYTTEIKENLALELK